MAPQTLSVKLALQSLVVVAVLVVSFRTASAGNSHAEDFSTTTYKDVATTTADWNTTVGRLQLFRLPTFAGQYTTPDPAWTVAVAGDHAYVADGFCGLLVFDISDPSAPTLAGSYDTPGLAFGVALAGDHAYVADQSSGLQVIDISDPTTPVLAGSYPAPGIAWSVAVAGDHAYVAAAFAGLHVIDISDPTAPTLVGTYNTPGSAEGVVVDGDHAFVADGPSGLRVIDISDPTAPTLAGSYDTPDFARGVAVSGDYAYVGDGSSGLQVIDISDPTAPALAGSFNTPSFAGGVAVDGDHAYVADGASGLQVIDVSDPTAPVLAASYQTPDVAIGVTLSGDHAFVAGGAAGLRVIKISDPIAPTLAGNYDLPAEPRGVAVAGNHAYFADVSSAFWILDISDPTAPTLAGSYPAPAHSVAVAGNHAYLAAGTSGLKVIDISDPTAPTLSGSYDTPGDALGVAVAGDHAYVADGISGLQVIDISDPTAPTLAGSYDTPDNARAVAVAGDLAYVADEFSGLQVLDISDPTAPALLGSYDTPDRARDVAVAGDHAYVADMSSGLQVIDISNPAAPTLAGSYNTPDLALGIAVAGDHAYVADGIVQGLLVIDISDPTSPTLAGSYNTPGAAWGVALAGDHAYVADGFSVQVVRVRQREFNLKNNRGQSHAINASPDTALKARITTTQQGTVAWELSTDGATSWQSVPADGSWQGLIAAGDDLRWRSTHSWSGPGINPGASRLQIDWLVQPAVIDSIVDVPGDQGGFARLHFTRSGYDFADETAHPITGYQLYRRVDAAAATSQVASHATLAREPPGHLAHLSPGSYSWVDDALRVDGALAGAGFPPGTWELLSFYAATQSEAYVALVPTLADSGQSGVAWTSYFLTAHTPTPSVWYASAADSGYSIDNIAPGAPTGLQLAAGQLTWDESPDRDFQHFSIHGSAANDLGAATLLGHSVDPSFDVTTTPYEWYLVTASDHAGNRSEPASVMDSRVGVPQVGHVPAAFALEGGAPNPFRGSTGITFGLPRVERARIAIFDVRGSMVRILVDEILEPGTYRPTWSGRDEQGRSVAPGVYFVRMEAGEFRDSKKVLLLD